MDSSSRFSGIERLYTPDGFALLRKSHVAVVGLGGVGSWTAEALARSGVGALTLIDPDDVCVSNTNRQLHALDGTVGKPKAEVMAERLRRIHPDCTITTRQVFLTRENAASLLPAVLAGVVDAIDGVTAKAWLIAACRDAGIPVITCGAAGGKRDPSLVRTLDLAEVHDDRLMMYVRKKLRKRCEFPRVGKPMGVPCVFSPEPVFAPEGCVIEEPAEDEDLAAPTRLNCEGGLGAATFVTGVFGFIAAAWIVNTITGTAPTQQALNQAATWRQPRSARRDKTRVDES